MLGRRRLSNLLQFKALFYFIFRIFFAVTSFGFLTVKVSAFPSLRKADYSFSCSYLLFIPFWYSLKGAEGISQPGATWNPCGIP